MALGQSRQARWPTVLFNPRPTGFYMPGPGANLLNMDNSKSLLGKHVRCSIPELGGIWLVVMDTEKDKVAIEKPDTYDPRLVDRKTLTIED